MLATELPNAVWTLDPCLGTLVAQYSRESTLEGPLYPCAMLHAAGHPARMSRRRPAATPWRGLAWLSTAVERNSPPADRVEHAS
jgi:hypothetical protein